MGMRMKIPPKKGVILLIIGALLAISAILLGRIISHRNQSGYMTNEDRLQYLTDLGYTAEEIPVTEQIVTLPAEFPPVLEQYNTLQLQQGFDLKQYKENEVEMYLYRLTNYSPPDNSSEVFACLYIYKDSVIGGDIHSASMTGFMIGLRP